MDTLIEMVADKNRKLALNSLDKIKVILCESLREEVSKANYFVVDELTGKPDEELIEGYFFHKMKLILEKLTKVTAL